jgi:chromosomal replication initiation ATPase DnaA
VRRRIADDEVVANIFARAYADTKSIADAFWVTQEVLSANQTHDAATVNLNQLIADVAAARGLRPETILGYSTDAIPSEARYEVWWRARQFSPPLSYPALGFAFGRHHTTVMTGVKRFVTRMANSAELRARVLWTGRAKESAA